MRNARLEQLVWVLIYGGVLVLSLGAFVADHDTGFGWTLITAGLVAAAGGAALIVVRARRPDDS